jgi:HK97 family phage portal protein
MSNRLDKFKRLFIKPVEERSTELKAPEQRGFVDEWQNPILGTLNLYNSNNYSESKALKLSTVYRAVNVISDSVAILNLDNYLYKDNWKYKEQNTLHFLLNIQPNSLMSAYTFKKLMVQNILLKGNAYILIKRDKKHNPIELTLLDSDQVQVYLSDGNLKYKDQSTNQTYDQSDIVHIQNYSLNGLIGVSTLTYASLSLSTSYASESHANNFFSGGGALAGLLRPIAGVNLTKDKATAAKRNFVNALNSDLGGASNSIVVLDSGLEYQQITVSPKDAQLLESRQFNSLAISQFFGVPLSKLFDKSNTSYSSAEAEQIDFLNSTLLPLLEKIENEFYRKLFLPIDYSKTELRFEVSNLLRLDANTQADVYTKYFNLGVMTTNEIREKINSPYPVKGGNRAFVLQNAQPLDNILNDIKNNKNTNTNKNE